MVRSGWAIAWPGRDYQHEEEQARAARRGLWQGAFQRPEDWRRNRHKTGPDEQ
jgi:endonuclease YncB( thermonuclease family)